MAQEAPEHGLEIEAREGPEGMEYFLNDQEKKKTASDSEKVSRGASKVQSLGRTKVGSIVEQAPEEGEEAPKPYPVPGYTGSLLDVARAREYNQQRTKEAYGAAGRTARPEDVAASKQAFDTAVALGLPLEEVTKTVELEDPGHRADRESRERGQEMGLRIGSMNQDEARALRAEAIAEQRRHNMEAEALARENQGLRAGENQARGARAAQSEALRWRAAAEKTASQDNSYKHSDVNTKIANVISLLDKTPIVEGAKLDKTHAAMITFLVKAAQGDADKVSNQDRDQFAEDWQVVDRVGGILSGATQGELSDQQVLNFKEALARIYKGNQRLLEDSFDKMAGAIPRGNGPAAVDQYVSVMSGIYANQPWAEEKAKKMGFSLNRGNVPIPGGAPPVVPTATSPEDDDMIREAEEALNAGD